MKALLIIWIVLGFTQTAWSGPKADSNSVQFGEKIKASEITTLEKVVGNYGDYKGKTVVFEAVPKKVCETKGCWMVLEDGKQEVRTLFKDYGFFVPKSILGKKVRVKGQMEQKKVSAATIRHYMKDAGRKMEDIKKVKTGEIQFQFIADGVHIL